MRRRGNRMGKGARTLARTWFGINPVAAEKRFCLLCHLLVKTGKGIQHQLARLVPAELPVITAGKRRITVPPVDRLATHPSGFQPVIAMREVGVARINRTNKCVDRVIIHIIIEIA